MEQANEIEILNPDIKEVLIGIRTLKKLKIYPLSVVDQMKLTDLFTEALGIFLANKSIKDIELVTLFVQIIKKNLSQILTLVVDEDANELLADISNNQLTDIANVLYTVNYEVISKNVNGLLKKLPQNKESALVRPLQPSAVPTDTDLTTFTGNLGETEE